MQRLACDTDSCLGICIAIDQLRTMWREYTKWRLFSSSPFTVTKSRNLLPSPSVLLKPQNNSDEEVENLYLINDTTKFKSNHVTYITCVGMSWKTLWSLS